MNIYTVGSMFSGVGGICLGFQNAKTEKSGYRLLWANEIDEYACETYRNNFSHKLLQGDIKKILRPELVDEDIEKARTDYENASETEKERAHRIYLRMKEERDFELAKYEKMHQQILEEPIDILNGGFPCQAFSIAGEQKGFKDERGNLFLNIVDLIEQLGEKFYKPRVLFLENVKNLKSHDKGRTYTVIKQKLEECGYTVFEHVLNTMEYSNLPQNRERIYIIGFLNSDDAEKFKLFEEENLKEYCIEKTMEERAQDIKDIIDYSMRYKDGEKYYYTREKYPRYFVSEEEFANSAKSERINLDEQINEMYQFYQCRRGMYVRKNKSGVCPTLTANMGTGGHNVPLIKVPDGIRKLTPAETFKLQGFPVGNGYTLPDRFNGKRYSDAQLYKQAGNAVSVPVITFLAEKILEILEQ